MEIRLLQEYVVFAKHLNFTAAAEELFIAQPTLSLHMAKLEKELGLALIEHSTPPRLTASGRSFLMGAQTVLDAYDLALADARASAASKPPIRIYDPAEALDSFYDMLGKSSVPLSFVKSSKGLDLFEALSKSIVDVGFAMSYGEDALLKERLDHSGLAAIPVLSMNIGFASMKDRPLSADEDLTRERLSGCILELGDGAFFDQWKTVVAKALSDDSDKGPRMFNFRLSSSADYHSMRYADFGPLVQVCELDSLRNVFSRRSDVVVFDEVDGKRLEFSIFACYKSDSESEDLHRFLGDIVSS